MKVVAVLPLYPPASRIGAWIATHGLLAGGVQRGWTVEVVTYMATASTYTLDGVTVHGAQHSSDVLDDADVVVTHLGDNGKTAPIAKERGLPQVRMVHGYSGWSRGRLNAQPPDLAVFNSHVLANRVNWSGPSVVVHPPVRPQDYKTTPGDRITLVNISADKGADLFWLLARVNQQWPFLGVRGCYNRQVIKHRLDNTEVIPTTEDMREVYSRTRVLLVPSKDESFGMVGLEAMASGIPVVASDLPGIREALGEAGIYVSYTNSRGWQAELTRLQDPDEWQSASLKAAAHALAYDPEPEIDRFVEACESLS